MQMYPVKLIMQIGHCWIRDSLTCLLRSEGSYSWLANGNDI